MNNTGLPLALSQQSLSPKEAAESLRLFVTNIHSRMLTERMYVQIVLFDASFTKSAMCSSAKSDKKSISSQDVEANTGPQDSDHEPNGCVARRRDFCESGAEKFSADEVEQNNDETGQNPLLQADKSFWQVPTNSEGHLKDDWDLNAERIFNKHRLGNWPSNSKSTLCPASCSLFMADDLITRTSSKSVTNGPADVKNFAEALPQSVADLQVTLTFFAPVHTGPDQQQNGASFQPRKEAFSPVLHFPVEDGMALPAEALNQRLSRSNLEIGQWAYACWRRKKKLVGRGTPVGRNGFVTHSAMPGGCVVSSRFGAENLQQLRTSQWSSFIAGGLHSSHDLQGTDQPWASDRSGKKPGLRKKKKPG